MRQHLIHVVQHTLHELTLGLGADERKRDLAKVASISEKKGCKHRNYNYQPGLLGNFSDSNSHPLSQLHEIPLVLIHHVLHPVDRRAAQPVIPANLFGDFTESASVYCRCGQRGTEFLSFTADLRSNKEKERYQQHDEQQINHSNRAAAAMCPLLNP